jgi:hypothetical protein
MPQTRKKEKGIIIVHTTPLSPVAEELIRLNNLLFWYGGIMFLIFWTLLNFKIIGII